MNLKFTRLFALVALFTSVCGVCLSCGDDENDPTHYEEPADYVGDYFGTMSTFLTSRPEVGEMEMGDSINQHIELRLDSAGIATVIYHDWSYLGVNYGDLVFYPVRIEQYYIDNVTKFKLSCECTQILYKGVRGFEAALALDGQLLRTSDGHSVDLSLFVNMPVDPTMTLRFRMEYLGEKKGLMFPG